ncbi:class I SAM-dependent methyltransferase [Bifidobacterium merycicum]|uniref:Methyltransferase domain n=1 Tax=Bifidobacterium merycicum TaxID=78345 RepID=A0A087BHW7_9BIFI|nr:methyltransferase [Bifidobacterium merycicum]KFI70617.1 methyltransferase domain [Bifidobacterium merycicum]MBQ1513808.1 methyltransferase [Bifidobacterium sp.]MEE1294897.1 methyltransferase [Bifidobacterium merycicum]SHE28647.1 16S RNA G1207 methylase RsmC [Bifidobacterium merycicum DSM 6492]
MAEQYFSADPSSKDVRRTLHVQLRGRDTDVEVSNGVFSGSRLDLGTSVLLKQAPEPPEHGNLLDLGCGWGPIALSLAFASPEATVWAADVNERALELTELNAKRNGCGNVRVIRTDADAKPVDPTALSPDLTFDAIWSNPPIRIGKEALHTMLMNWLPRLSPDGVTYLVVQKNLGADSLINWLADALGDGYAVSKYHSAKGFRVIEVARA